MLIIASSPIFAITPDTRAKMKIHLPREREGQREEKYSPHEERSPTEVLKHAMMNIAAIRILPYDGSKNDAAAERISAPVLGLSTIENARYPITAKRR